MRPPQWEKLYRHLSREYSEKRERERETLWMIMIITKVETVTGTDNVLQLFSGLRLLHS